MFRRKNSAPRENLDFYRQLQGGLAEDMKLKVVICETGGEPVSACVWSEMGDRGLELFRANGFRAMKLGSSHLLYWYLIKTLKESGFRYFDMGNATSPNLMRFKTSLGAKAVSYLAPHTTGDSVLGKMCGGWGQQVIQKATNARFSLVHLGNRMLGTGGK